MAVRSVYVVATLLCALFVAAAIFFVHLFSKGELAEKPIWAELQGVELDHREQKGLNMPMLIKGSAAENRHDMLGVRSESKIHSYVWINLNEVADDGSLYVMPSNVPFYLSCADLKSIEAGTKIDVSVDRSLRLRCE